MIICHIVVKSAQNMYNSLHFDILLKHNSCFSQYIWTKSRRNPDLGKKDCSQGALSAGLIRFLLCHDS